MESNGLCAKNDFTTYYRAGYGTVSSMSSRLGDFQGYRQHSCESQNVNLENCGKSLLVHRPPAYFGRLNTGTRREHGNSVHPALFGVTFTGLGMVRIWGYGQNVTPPGPEYLTWIPYLVFRAVRDAPAQLNSVEMQFLQVDQRALLRRYISAKEVSITTTVPLAGRFSRTI